MLCGWEGNRRVDDLITCRLTACTPGSAPDPTLGNEYGKPLLFYLVDEVLQLNVNYCALL